MKLTYIATAGLIALVGTGVYLVVQNEAEGQKHEMQADFDRKMQEMEKRLKEQAKKDDQTEQKMKDAAELAKTATAPGSPGATRDPGIDEALKIVKTNLQGNPAVEAAANSNPGVAAPRQSDPASVPAQLKKMEDDLLHSALVGTERIAVETGKLTGAIPEENPENLNELQSLILAQPRIARVGDVRAAETAGFIVLDEGQNKGLKTGDRFAVRRGTIVVARITVADNVLATQCVANITPNTLVAGMSIKVGDDVIQFDR